MGCRDAIAARLLDRVTVLSGILGGLAAAREDKRLDQAIKRCEPRWPPDEIQAAESYRPLAQALYFPVITDVSP